VSAKDPGEPSAAASAFAAALASAAKQGLPEPAPDPRVAAAFAMGWQVAALYRPEQRGTVIPASEDDLPSTARLSDAELLERGLQRIQVAIHGLHDVVERAGVALPDVGALRSELAAATDARARRGVITTLHAQLGSILGAADFRLGKAYGLGRALADTTRNPVSLETLRAEMTDARVASLVSWLDDLASAFPPHAGHSVRESLRAWHAWAAAAGDRTDVATWALLRRQGELWRSLLTGEKRATDMLEIGNYLDAAERLAEHGRTIAWRFVRRFPVVVAIVVVLFAAGVVLLVAQSSSASTLAGLGSIVAALGLTWRGIGDTLGKLAAKLEPPLWGAELDTAITQAITLVPGAPPKHDPAGRRGLARALLPHIRTGAA
jgi:hypothetical protein